MAMTIARCTCLIRLINLYNKFKLPKIKSNNLHDQRALLVGIDAFKFSFLEYSSDYLSKIYIVFYGTSGAPMGV